MKKIIYLLIVFAFFGCEKETVCKISNDKEYKVYTDSETLVSFMANGAIKDTLIYSNFSLVVNDNNPNYLLRAMKFDNGELRIIANIKGEIIEKYDIGNYPSLNIDNIY